MKSIRKFNKKKNTAKQIQQEPDLQSVSSDEDITINFWDRFKSHSKMYFFYFSDRQIASSFLCNAEISQNLDLTSLGNVNTIVNQLTDSEPEVVQNVLKGIENLSYNENFYQNLMKTNIIQHLKNILKNYQNNLFLNDKIKNIMIKSVYELSSILCETTPSQYLQVWEEIFQHGITFLQTSQNVLIEESILDFISVLTEINLMYNQQIIKNTQLVDNWILRLQSNSAPLQISGYICIILYNLINNLQYHENYQNNPLFQKGKEKIIQEIELFLHKSMGIKIFEEFQNFKQIYKDDQKDLNQKALMIWTSSSKAIQLSLGLLIMIFEFEDGFQDIDDNISEEFIEESQNNFQNTSNKNKSDIQSILQANLQNSKVDNLILDKLQPILDEHLDFLDQEKFLVLQACQTINHLGVSFFSNFLNQLSDESKMELGQKIWEIIQNHDNSEIILQSLKLFYQLIQNANFLQLTNSQQILNTTKKIVEQNEEEEIVLVCLDILAHRFQPKFQIPQEIIEQTCDFIISQLNVKNLMVVAQALNVVFDVFQEESLDHIFKQKEIMNILQKGYELFKGQVQKLKGQNNYSFLRDCCNNLKRFIQYKKEQGC